MSEEVYSAIAQAKSGFVEAPAGCGKTQAIVRTVEAYCDERQLILTHTHAGVDVLRQRFRKHQVPTNKYHIDTIAGWAWGWVRRYPINAGYEDSCEIPNWGGIYAAMSNLLGRDYVRKGILNSYAGVIVDEYQDCTVPMHKLINQLKCLLPCRVLGDDLQGIFNLGGDPLIEWGEVQKAFENNLGTLLTPHRWINASNEALGRWLINERPKFREGCEPDYNGSSIERSQLQYNDLSAELISLSYKKRGRICIIGPKTHSFRPALETTLVNHSYRILEANDLKALRDVIVPLADGDKTEKADATFKFLSKSYGGLTKDIKGFLRKILKGTGNRPVRADRRAVFDTHREGTTPLALAELLGYIEGLNNVSCKLCESVSALKCILEEHLNSGADLKFLYAEEIAKRKYQSRSNVFRCIGKTLLVKGLEFDHVVIIRNANWQESWGTYKDLYVALSRGSKSVRLIDLAG